MSADLGVGGPWSQSPLDPEGQLQLHFWRVKICARDFRLYGTPTPLVFKGQL